MQFWRYSFWGGTLQEFLKCEREVEKVGKEKAFNLKESNAKKSESEESSSLDSLFASINCFSTTN